jgi:hypothetical protein
MSKKKALKEKALKNDIKAFAEELYMQIGRDGKHKHSSRKDCWRKCASNRSICIIWTFGSISDIINLVL